jgi:hypothetical protein
MAKHFTLAIARIDELPRRAYPRTKARTITAPSQP